MDARGGLWWGVGGFWLLPPAVALLRLHPSERFASVRVVWPGGLAFPTTKNWRSFFFGFSLFHCLIHLFKLFQSLLVREVSANTPKKGEEPPPAGQLPRLARPHPLLHPCRGFFVLPLFIHIRFFP